MWPSKVGVPKPFYFIVQPSYWFPRANTKFDDVKTNMNGVEEDGTSAVPSIPTEEANEALLGPPAIVVNKLCKTYGQQVSVNDLSFKMYENQIFALLGHNGAGKVLQMSALCKHFMHLHYTVAMLLNCIS